MYEEYRWHEVSYKHNAFYDRGPSVGPFPIQAVDDIYANADGAAGGGMHTIEIEFGPVPVEAEDLDAFVERWLSRLATAHKGRLREARDLSATGPQSSSRVNMLISKLCPSRLSIMIF